MRRLQDIENDACLGGARGVVLKARVQAAAGEQQRFRGRFELQAGQVDRVAGLDASELRRPARVEALQHQVLVCVLDDTSEAAEKCTVSAGGVALERVGHVGDGLVILVVVTVDPSENDDSSLDAMVA